MIHKLFHFLQISVRLSLKFVNKIIVIIKDEISHDSELKTRIYSGILFGLIFIISIGYGGMVFNSMILFLAITGFKEWFNMIDKAKEDEKRYKFWNLVGVFYITIPFAALISIRQFNHGVLIVVWYFLIIWATDCGAYFVGKRFGGTKLVPSISPNKTINGAIGGIIASVIASFILYSFVSKTVLFEFGFIGNMIFAAIISILAQCGDIFESWIKRLFNLKDTGNFLPGHGGILDRMDSITYSAPFLWLIVVKISESLGL